MANDMSERKTEVINLRMTPRVKELLREAASREHRSLSNMLEVLIEGYFHAQQGDDDGVPARHDDRAPSVKSKNPDAPQALGN